MDEVRLLQVLGESARAVRDALNGLDEWGPAGTRPGQYRLDLAADAAALPILHGAGLEVLSEESGKTGDPSAPLMAVIDPVDGSTNAHRGIPFYATSICVLDAEGPLVGMVVNQATGRYFEAGRGGGARCNGEAIAPSGCTELSAAIVGISGFPGIHPGWAQCRALGAAALEFCAVADGSLDGYLLGAGYSLRPWDYLAGLLICVEAGASVSELDGLDAWIRSDDPRRPVAAATDGLLRTIMSGAGA